jgi:hypothetical protein
MRIKTFAEFLLEDFADDYPKNTWEDIADTKDKYAESIAELIKKAYAHIGGNLQFLRAPALAAAGCSFA